MPSETLTLGEALPIEQARIRALIIQYNDPILNGAGTVAALMMEMDLRETDKAVISGDVVRMLTCYNKLCEY